MKSSRSNDSSSWTIDDALLAEPRPEEALLDDALLAELVLPLLAVERLVELALPFPAEVVLLPFAIKIVFV
jgi:hypothetical protein